MNIASVSKHRMNPTEGIAGDRRSDRRYDISLELRWKLIRRRRLLDSGVGHTLDLSSGGILFDAGCQLPANLNVELSISWPFLLHNVAPLQLIVSGRIVRSANNRIAVRITQHEFRTQATAECRPGTGTHPHTPPSLLSAQKSVQALGMARW
jgi:hypothetical protein